MSELIAFQFRETGQAVRTVMVDGEPWFVAADVCAALGIGNPRQAVSHLDGDEVRQVPVTTTDGSGRTLPTNVINEPGLYSLILRSRKPEAKAFKRWITHEVLPAIRKTGGYISPAATDEQLAAIIGRARAQMEVLRLADGLVSRDWLEAKARHVVARALGEEPEIDPARRPLTVGEYLEERGITGPALRSLSGPFGKVVKRLYRDRYDREPPQTDRFVDGALRKVAAYTEADRELMDAAFVLIGAAQ